ncbi:MAG: type II toxin-antitoxin system VapC family toxin [Paracoccaceae bacterium]
MRFLFDTQLLVWLVAAPGRLPGGARGILDDGAERVSWSAVSVWEVAIKAALGRPDFVIDVNDFLAVLRQSPLTGLPMVAEHALPVTSLPPLHKDPFDRLLLAQAVADGMTLVTADRQLPGYPVPIRRV